MNSLQLEPGTELHFEVRLRSASLKFIRRPTSTQAEEDTIALLDGISEKGNQSRTASIFKNGEWRGGKHGSELRFSLPVWKVLAT